MRVIAAAIASDCAVCTSGFLTGLRASAPFRCGWPFAHVTPLPPREVRPVAVAFHEIAELPLGFLSRSAAPLLNLAEAPGASASGERVWITRQRAPLFFYCAPELPSGAEQTIQVHADPAPCAPSVDVRSVIGLRHSVCALPYIRRVTFALALHTPWGGAPPPVRVSIGIHARCLHSTLQSRVIFSTRFRQRTTSACCQIGRAHV